MPAAHAVELPVLPLLSLLQRENLGEPHAVFAGGERYISPRFADAAEQALQQELRTAGLGERRDYDEFLDLLTLVQQADVEYYGWVTTTDEPYALLVARSRRSAVLVLRKADRVRFERVDAEKMLTRLVFLLPDVQPGRGDVISVSSTDFHAATSRAEGSVMRLPASARPEHARRLDTLLKADRVSLAKLYTAKRDARGTRTRSEQWLTVLDLADGGRWALSVGNYRGQKWITATPGLDDVLVARLDELARSVG
jgi:hypothetical protein